MRSLVKKEKSFNQAGVHVHASQFIVSMCSLTAVNHKIISRLFFNTTHTK